MKNNSSGWAPTITLAKLFEEQNQFFDALAAYELISQTDSSPELKESIEELHLRILSDPVSRYDARIEQLFTPEELAYLRIMDHQGFQNLAQAREKLNEGSLGVEIYLDEEEDFLEDDEAAVDALALMLQEIEEQAQVNLAELDPESPEFTVRDLLIAFLGRFDKERKLSEIRLSDLVAVILEMQGIKE
ncbi:MAG: hypothetical protein WCY21_06970 [Candidatus Cloacimonadaceae bacterium]|nr:hypothetical protein [Candidatus Cloacimonadota bacterium]MDX9950153.1 hypothetical protein [Candidatus Syntrophosphaera sp.]NLN85358.1 hypothetical protein [Candidatus Cloacimonadota bacterium]